ncbi:MAG TPA: polysaccharide biosynthesis C-terminal domain-containing protein [Tepidiformaceae bacterium]|nr:polysaccharide biosynthesis C-terminal domain-containing protein [Tepidiformaceae bacterium]
MEIAIGTLKAFVYRVSGIVVWALLGIITARALSVEDRGTYASMVVLMFIVSALAPSIPASAGYFVSKKGRPAPEVMSASLLMAGGISIVQCLILGAWGFLRWDDKTLVPIIGLGVFPQVARLALSSVFLGTGHIGKQALGANGQAYWGLACILVWVIALDHRTAADALGAFVLGQYIAVASMLVIAGPQWRRQLFRLPPRETMRGMLSYGILPGIATVVGMANYRFDQVLVIRLDGATGAGIYASAVTLAEGLWLFSGSISTASFHRIGTLAPSEAATLTANTFRHMVLPVAAMATGVALLAPWLIGGLYGDRYLDGVNTLRILCVGTALFAPTSLLNTYFMVQLGRPVIGLLLSSVSAAINIALCFVLIPHVGYIGAAWATLIAYGAGACLGVALFVRMSGLPLSLLVRIRKDDLSGYVDVARTLLRGRLIGARPAAAAGESTTS